MIKGLQEAVQVFNTHAVARIYYNKATNEVYGYSYPSIFVYNDHFEKAIVKVIEKDESDKDKLLSVKDLEKMCESIGEMESNQSYFIKENISFLEEIKK